MLVGGLGGAGLQEALQSDEPLYKCTDENKIRNCVNGVKADGKRCYYNESNPYSYDYCSSNWTEINKQEVYNELYGSEEEQENNTRPEQSEINAQKVKCKEGSCKGI